MVGRGRGVKRAKFAAAVRRIPVKARDAVGVHHCDDTVSDVGRRVLDDLARHRVTEARSVSCRRGRAPTEVADHYAADSHA